MNKKFVIISIAIALLIVAIITGSSYAYFSTLNQTGSEEVITSGNMALTLTDGAVITTNSMIPGDYIEKEFSIENTGNLATNYDVYLSEVINNFVDQTDLVYEIISLDGGYNTTNPVQVPNVSTKIVNQQSIGVGVTHHYKLKITFLSKNENQDDNQEKLFSAKIQINEYHDIETTINYYLDNTLVNIMPNNNYNYLNTTCDKNGTVTFDTTNWTYTTNIVQNNTTCNIYFESPIKTMTYNNTMGYSCSEKTGIYNQNWGTLCNPSVSGYEFNGWYTSENGNGTKIEENTTVTNDINVYGYFNKIIGPSKNLSKLYSSIGVEQKGVKGIVYLDPTNLSRKCNAGNSNAGEFGTSGCMKWYIYDDTGDNYKLILNHNTHGKYKWGSSNVPYNESNVYTAIQNLGWDSSLNTTIISAYEVASITGNTNFNANANSGSYYYVDTNNTTCSTNGKGKSSYAWLFDYTNACVNYGCDVSASGDVGYWLRDRNPGTNREVWAMYYGLVNSSSDLSGYGIRPVITIPKADVE